MKKIVIIILGVLIKSGLFAQAVISERSINALIDNETDLIYGNLVGIRRDIHKFPELSEHEKRTSAIIASYLDSLGLEVRTNIGGYGVVGILKGAKPGKHIAWRADIDAVKSDLPDVVEFESRNKGVRHICGHDVHTTIGLGIANILSKHKDKINGTIYFIFQPSEEILNKGAQSMISEGLFDVIDPTEIYALHITPLPVGQIATKENELYAYFRKLTIQFKDVSDKENVVKYTQGLVKSYNTVDAKFWDNRNIGNPQIGICSPQTIYKNYLAVTEPFNVTTENNTVEISTMIYGTDIVNVDSLCLRLKAKINNSAYSNNLLTVNYDKQHPTINNNMVLTQETLQSISSVYGKAAVVPIYGIVGLFNDDFSYFQQRVPGVYFLLGGSNFEKGIISMPHSPTFAVDEGAIKIGVKYFSSMLMIRLNSK
jgi:metal-dependent amidase/aminoacylase/carboxypeptidase family protein